MAKGGSVPPPPPAAVRHGRARQSSGGPCWNCRRFLWVLSPRDQYSKKFVLSTNLGYEGDCHVANVVVTSTQQRHATGKPGKVRGRDCVGIVEGPAVSVFVKNSFYLETLATRGGGRHVAKRSSDPPAAVRHGRARQSSGKGPCVDCRRGMWVPGPRGQYTGKIHFIEKPGVQGDGGRHVAKRSTDHPLQQRYPAGKPELLRDGTAWGM